MSDIVEAGATVAAAVGILLFLGLILAVFFLPAIVASKRGSVSFVGIFLVNLLAGATGVFWIVALFWACFGTTKPSPSPLPSPPRVVSPSTFAALTVRGARHK